MQSCRKRIIRAAAVGDERLWRVWWLLGIPVGLATSALTVGAELMRQAGPALGGWADLLDVVRLLVYLGWAQLAWRCSHNVEDWRWTSVSRCVISAGLVLQVML